MARKVKQGREAMCGQKPWSTWWLFAGTDPEAGVWWSVEGCEGRALGWNELEEPGS